MPVFVFLNQFGNILYNWSVSPPQISSLPPTPCLTLTPLCLLFNSICLSVFRFFLCLQSQRTQRAIIKSHCFPLAIFNYLPISSSPRASSTIYVLIVSFPVNTIFNYLTSYLITKCLIELSYLTYLNCTSDPPKMYPFHNHFSHWQLYSSSFSEQKPWSDPWHLSSPPPIVNGLSPMCSTFKTSKYIQNWTSITATILFQATNTSCLDDCNSLTGISLCADDSQYSIHSNSIKMLVWSFIYCSKSSSDFLSH